MWSVVIPTYNRLPILEKCLRALEAQQFDCPYEVVVVDDGSTDGTVDFLRKKAAEFPHVRLLQQEHGGPAEARNRGVAAAQGDTIVFIDSDLVVLPDFLAAHAAVLGEDSRAFTYGSVINTCNFADPTQEPFKLTDWSNAYFATGNVAIAKHWLEAAGLFDTTFRLYGWEDLELGVRLKKLGLTLRRCPQAVGFHWHPPFDLSQMPALIERERQRARMGALFYQKHPTLNVRLMIQMTWLHRVLWGLLSLGGTLNENTLHPFLAWLIAQGKSQWALEVARIFLNWYGVQSVYTAYRELTAPSP
ncbi:MAG TPA: family 2 glycosyl transferase [Cyanobacteria bacterium UBA8156]|nr:family 2 glycosyl transferase [Cyanobacteria bacterium UBA8156]